MIFLSIDNASEIIAQKLGKFIESITPHSFDEAKVEDVVIRKLVEHLAAEGLCGEIASVRGVHLGNKTLHINEELHVRHQEKF
ncbi:MAG: hypothetical protein FJ083_03480 [Cyanobacteria bacterium K_Offshore_surface_m2_239]|nr:hypothetical protein [Cyanobacteria bacterium K_Offshore_surface_m2_239]